MEIRPRRAGLTFLLDEKSQQKNQDRFSTRVIVSIKDARCSFILFRYRHCTLLKQKSVALHKRALKDEELQIIKIKFKWLEILILFK
jgi:hypothetical protein